MKNKHDLLHERLQAAIALQQETKAFVLKTHDTLSTMSGDSVDPDMQRNIINETYQQYDRIANHLSNEMKAIDRLAKGLFIEWHRALRQYDNQHLRAKSAKHLSHTKKHYHRFKSAMKKSYRSLAPLLSLLHDNDLYLKHNHSAKALKAFQQEVTVAETKIDTMVKEIDLTIEASEAFASVIEGH